MDRSKNSYKAIPINQRVEVLSMLGDIAVHTHLVVGLDDASAKGGHLIEAHVDPETGLGLINPETP
jgi:predicted DNA-binding protein with PD1-like motif